MTDSQMVALAARKDIFEIESDRRMSYTLLGALILGILLGVYFTMVELVSVPPEFYENLPESIMANILPEIKKEEEKKKEKKEEKKEKLKQLKEQKIVRAPGQGVGKGDIKQRVTQKGLLAIISGKTKSKDVAGAAFNTNVFAKNLDEVLENIGGLKTSGDPRVGRAGIASAKFNQGYAGAGGAGGIDDLLSGLAGRAASAGNLRRESDISLPNDKAFWAGQADGLGGRNPEDIYRVVMQHIGGLRHEYNKRLRDRPGLKGKVTVKFTIAPGGEVVSCQVVGTTINDKSLELQVVSKVRTWRFDACSKCGLATVTYPFAFSQ